MTEEHIRKYLRGELDEAERQKVTQWIATQSDAWLEQYVTDKMDQPVMETPQETKQAMFTRVMTAIAAQQTATADTVSTAPVRRMTISRILPWIAAACILVAAGMAWWQLSGSKKTPPHTIAWQTIRNDSNGVIRKMTLPDSTVVVLNAHSSISFSTAYNKSNRELRLTGEAFFDVAHNDKKPFLVQAGNATVRVYGTAFNIQAYPGYSQLQVALQRGKLGVSYQNREDSRETILAPGQLLLYNKTTGIASMELQPPQEMGGWTTGKLVFFKTPLKDALLRLENLYKVRFLYNHNLLHNQTITATFDHTSLQKVLQHLSFVWNLQFQQKGDDIYLK